MSWMIPPQFRALFWIALALSLVATGWVANGWRLNAKHDADKLAAAKAAKEAYDAKAKQYNEASAALEAARNEREIVYRTIEKRVEKVVTRDVYRNVCLDHSGLQLVNDALAGRASDPAEPAPAVPATDAP
jgi:hypothetical protein